MTEYDLQRYMAYEAYIAPLGDEHQEQLFGAILYWLKVLAGEKDVEPDGCVPYARFRRHRKRRQSTAAMRSVVREAIEAAANPSDEVIVSDERAE